MSVELERCILEQRLIQECTDVREGNAPAWLVTLGMEDWEMEKRMIIAESIDSASDYDQFLESKRLVSLPAGFDPTIVNDNAFDFQRDIVRWACKRGSAAIWAGTGMGKTLMQLMWSDNVAAHTGGNVLILCPLAVAEQTASEAEKFGIPGAEVRRDGSSFRITISNYQMLHKIKPEEFAGIVLDESSCIKHHEAKTRAAIMEFCAQIKFRLSCTATPAPNDYMELGTQAEFLGIMSRTEMLATFFTHDGGDTAIWRLKKHGVEKFWEWVASWAVLITKPSDLGYDDRAFLLPKLTHHEHVVEAEWSSDYLFPVEAKTIDERRKARRDSIRERCNLAAGIANSSIDKFVVWCDLNDESEMLAGLIDGAVEIAGKHSDDQKVQRMQDFTSGRTRVLVTKPSIAGWGMNWQHCHKMIFVGLSDSFEAMYQATRRCWRFGQTNPVDVHIVTSALEGAVVRNIKRKEEQYEVMVEGMVKYMRAINDCEIHAASKQEQPDDRDLREGAGWKAYLGDSCEVLREIPDNSIHYSIYSPPFASLYTYTNSIRDLGNSRNRSEFFVHYRYIVQQLYRVLKPGRLLSFHCMNLPISKEREGYIGIDDFRGDLIRIHKDAGFILHSEVVIWKDPVTAMQRTKALGLLHKQILKDSCRSRQGIPDYLITMLKRGDNHEPVAGPFTHYIGDNPPPNGGGTYSIDVWQRYASPVWMDINPSDTMQRDSARENDDERHICPLQLQVIERALDLWTNEGDVVLSPFMGIGSEGYVALRTGRRFIGCELKRSYWEQARRNLSIAAGSQQRALYSEVAR